MQCNLMKGSKPFCHVCYSAPSPTAMDKRELAAHLTSVLPALRDESDENGIDHICRKLLDKGLS